MPEGNRPATREPALDMAKGIAVIGVVLIHTHTWLGAIGVRSAALDVIAGRLTIPLPEFFFVSGVVVASSVVGRDATSRSLWHRLRPILWLYVIWQPLVFAYRIVGDAFVRQEPVDWSGELIRLLAFPLRPNGELWYLWALALLLTLSYLTRNISSRVVIPIAALCFVAVYSFGELVLGAERWHELGPGLQQIVPHAVFTLVGVRHGAVLLRALDRVRWWHAAVVVACWQGYAALLAATPDGIRHAGVAVQVILGFVATFVVARCCMRVRVLRGLCALGRASLPVYVLHTSAVVALLAVVVQTGTTEVLMTAPSIAAAAVVMVVATYQIGRVTARGPLSWLFAPPVSRSARVAP